MTQVRTQVTPDMTPQEMREYYLDQTRLSLERWEKEHFSIRDHQPFALESDAASEFRLTPEIATKIGLRKQVEEFAVEAQVSTAGVRENQNVLYPWDHRYRINEYIFAMIAESLSRLAKELQPERVAELPPRTSEEIRSHLGDHDVKTLEEIYGCKLEEAIEKARQNPIRIVGGEVRSNTPRYVALMARIYAANGLPVFLTEDYQNTSTIFIWSFLTYILGLSGGDYFTSSHGAPQKQSDKILAPDGAQYLPPLYARIVEHMRAILGEIESGGYTFRLAANADPLLMRRLTYPRMASLYASYLRKGPASQAALALINQAIGEGLRLKLDFFGGAGGKTIRSIFSELGILGVFEGGLLREEEDPFFHNIGFRVSKKKGSEDYEVVHDSVDASLPIVVKSAGYDKLLKDAPVGQLVFNVDPDSDRFVVGQVVPAGELAALDRWGITSLELPDNRLFALYSPNQFFLMLAENDRLVAVEDGSWERYSNFDVHTYVSALSWDEWAQFHQIPVVRVPVGFKEIAAIERQVEQAMDRGGEISVKTELGEVIPIGARPKLHHAGEESGGKIGGPSEPIFNLFGQKVIAMREKSSGEACLSAVSLAARLWVESKKSGQPAHFYLHGYLERLFQGSKIANPMEFRGDIVHYNEAIFDPDELARAKQAGIQERVVFNHFFTVLAAAIRDGQITLEQGKELLTEALPGMEKEWKALDRIDVWSDGLQFWFTGVPVRDICVRPSGTDAKTKVYFDGTDKAYLKGLFDNNFQSFTPAFSARFKELIPSA